MAVTHDRYFLDNAAEWILELDRGHGIPWKGELLVMAGNKKISVSNTNSAVKQPTSAPSVRNWNGFVQTQKGRRAKSKARLQRFEELNSREYQKQNETREIYIPPGPRLGDQVIEVKHLNKGFGDRLLISDLSFNLPRAAIVGIIGGNGAGKTTLFRMLTGVEQPDSGHITIGSSVELAYVDQSRDSLDGGKKQFGRKFLMARETVSVGSFEMPSRGLCQPF